MVMTIPIDGSTAESQVDTETAVSLVPRGRLISVMIQDLRAEKLLSLAIRFHHKQDLRAEKLLSLAKAAPPRERIGAREVEVQGRERASHGWLAAILPGETTPPWAPRGLMETRGIDKIETGAMEEIGAAARAIDEIEMRAMDEARAMDEIKEANPEARSVEAKVGGQLHQIGARVR